MQMPDTIGLRSSHAHKLPHGHGADKRVPEHTSGVEYTCRASQRRCTPSDSYHLSCIAHIAAQDARGIAWSQLTQKGLIRTLDIAAT